MNTEINGALIAALAWSILLPIGLLAWWKKRTGAKLWCFLAGALCFLLFAMVLEQALHIVCLTGENRISEIILGSPAAYMLYGSLAAGLFEETGRLFGFRLLLRRHREKACAVAYGIGHGGIEVLLILGAGYLTLLLAQAGLMPGSEDAIAGLRASAEAITFATAGTAMFERISAMMIHIGLSMIVFVAAKQKGKFRFYPLAILLHAAADAPAALYQIQGRPSVPVVEAAAFLCGVLSLLIGGRLLAKYPEPGAEACDEPGENGEGRQAPDHTEDGQDGAGTEGGGIREQI